VSVSVSEVPWVLLVWEEQRPPLEVDLLLLLLLLVPRASFPLPNGTCCCRCCCYRWDVKCDGLWRYCYGPWVPEERNRLPWKKRVVFDRKQHMEQEQSRMTAAAVVVVVAAAAVIVAAAAAAAVAGSP
jgi:hypothetical protein